MDWQACVQEVSFLLSLQTPALNNLVARECRKQKFFKCPPETIANFSENARNMSLDTRSQTRQRRRLSATITDILSGRWAESASIRPEFDNFKNMAGCRARATASSLQATS